MAPETSITDLIRLTYDAAADPHRWVALLERLNVTFGAQASALYMQDLEGSGGATVTATAGYDQKMVRLYEQYYATRNVFLKGREALQSPQGVFDNDVLCSRQELYRSEFYNDWMKPQSLLPGLAAMIEKRGSTGVFLTVLRPDDAPAFEPADNALLAQLLSHLEHALKLQTQFANLQSIHAAAVAALDRWNTGVVVVNERGEVLLMNSAAEKIATQPEGLRYHGRRIEARNRDQNDRLQSLIVKAVQTNRTQSASPINVIAISRPLNGRPLRVLVSPIRSTMRIGPFKEGVALLFVIDPDVVPVLHADALQDWYDLTRTEAQLAAELLVGKTLLEAAAKLRIKTTTARTHLQNLFQKTGTRRQADLIRTLLTNSPNVLSHD